MYRIGTDILHDLPRALRLEWLETDGLGGFASGTVVGAATRRYHGHRITAGAPPVGRRVMVAGLAETLRHDSCECRIGCNVYEDVIDPQGHLLQTEFRLDPWPVFTWEWEGIRLEKAVLVPHGRNVTLVRYSLLEAPHAVWLASRPLVAGRDFHHLQRACVNLDGHLELTAQGFAIQPYDTPSRMEVGYPGGQFAADGLWYYSFRYLHEQERGLDYLEDLYSPGEISWLLHPGQSAWLIIGDAAATCESAQTWANEEQQRRRNLQECAGDDPVAARLVCAADSFLVQRKIDGHQFKSVIAGYPWFGDWGRDTMIALPGLTLATGRIHDFQSSVRAFLALRQDGLIPNNFGEGDGEPSYNTVDATLWLFAALREYYEATTDVEFIFEIWPALSAIISAHVEGTRFGIRMDEDGLLTAGDENTQLTWMDAKVGDWVVTPRHGKAVEINALWYNALKTAEFFAKKLEKLEQSKAYGRLARQVKTAFAAFWNEELGCCYDLLRPEGPDPALRANQIIAAGLHYNVLGKEQKERVLQIVSEKLLTPYGLRTLSPDDPAFCATYAGGPLERDGAYHQGIVWPWLLGPYLNAYFDVKGVNADTRRTVRRLLQPLVEHLDQAGLGSISEIFDAVAPHEPRGCIAQAWSVAEIVRCWQNYRLGEA